MGVMLPAWLQPFKLDTAECEHRAGGSVPARYDHIDFKPSASAAKAATRGIALRKKHGRGGLREGRNMAGRISRRESLHPDLVMKMIRYFSRFKGQAQKQRGTEKWDPKSDKVSNLRISWDLWGGDSGWAWARARRKQMDAADKRDSKSIKSLWARKAEQSRAEYWRGWLDSVQRPTERKIRAQWKRGTKGLFPDQSQRYARRLGQVMKAIPTGVVTRQITQAQLDAILSDELETQILLDEFDADVIEDALRQSFTLTARRVGLEAAWDPVTSPTEQIIGQMITEVQQTTKDRVAKLVVAGLDAGESVSAIQAALIADASFGPSRALLIARTETARTVSEGTIRAYEDAAEDGIEFLVEWVSSRDSRVRPSHQALDGTTVEPGGLFETPDGDTGQGPGLFSEASNVCNCRCTTRPIEVRVT